jgi:hypothetical protein
MGLLITLICLIVIGVILAIIIDKCFWYDNTLLQALAIVLIVVPLIVLLAFGVQNLAVDADRIEKTQEYEELMVYTEFVEEYTDDPGLHLIHKAKIVEWNRQYERYEANRNHPYWGLLVYPNIYRDCSAIEFDSIIDFD